MENKPNWEEIKKGFDVHFSPDQIKTIDKGFGSLSYVDARAVMQRLDDVVGMGNWGTDFRVVSPDKAVECALTIHGITKCDVGYLNSSSSAEPLKDAYSDALKRACVHFGIGRHLYSDENKKSIPREEVPRGTPKKEYTSGTGLATAKQVGFMNNMAKAGHVTGKRLSEFLFSHGYDVDGEVIDILGKVKFADVNPVLAYLKSMDIGGDVELKDIQV